MLTNICSCIIIGLSYLVFAYFAITMFLGVHTEMKIPIHQNNISAVYNPEVWMAMSVLDMPFNELSIFSNDEILRTHSKAIMDRLSELMTFFDDGRSVDDFYIVAVSKSGK